MRALDPHRCGQAEPTPEDWADALTPNGREREAVRRAVRAGWFDEDLAGRLERALGPDALQERLSGLYGQLDGAAQVVPEVMAAWYRLQAERYLLRPPPQAMMGEAVVPTAAEDWEPGDPVRDIDWILTLLQRGEVLGAALPLKRTQVAEVEGYDVPLWQPRIEIYLDVSGSMPDPRRQVNAMTLAAQILATAALKAGGRARAVLYSGTPVTFWEWTRSAGEISRFLMHYVGGGTQFPFGLLERSVAECGREQPIRVVITDTDFDGNYDQGKGNPRIFGEAARLSARCVLLQHRPNPAKTARYRAAGASVVAVEQMDAFPPMATALARALFPEDERGAV
jgi:Mg-chelatase subunit ChlD